MKGRTRGRDAPRLWARGAAGAALLAVALCNPLGGIAAAESSPDAATADGGAPIEDAAPAAPAPAEEAAAADSGAPALDAAQDEPTGEPAQAQRVARGAPSEELRRAEQVRRDQEKLLEQLKAEEQQTSADERHARIEGLARDARAAPSESADADALLRRVMDELRSLRPEIEADFKAATTPLDVPRLAPSEGAPAAQDEPPAPEAQKLAELRRSLSEAADALELEAHRRALARLTRALEDEEALDAARLLLLSRLTEDRSEEAFGVDREGIDQLRGELWHLGARARWYGLRRDSADQEIRAALQDPFVLITLASRGGLALAVIALAVTLSRRRRRLMDATWLSITRVVRGARVLRLLDRAGAVLASLSGELLLLASIWGVHRALGPVVAAVREVELTYSLLRWYALYRLALKAMHRGIEWQSSVPGSPLSEATSRKILRSLQAVGRCVLALGLVLAAAEATAGRGYLYHGVLSFAWLGAILLAWLLIRFWRGDICDAYLRLRPEGVLAEAVQRTRGKWYGFFVAIAAFSALVIARVGRAARSFVLGFELSHRLLAFLFRKRLERRAGAMPPDDLASGLPPDLIERLSGAPLLDPADGLDLTQCAGLDRFEASLAAWKQSHRIGSLLLVGGAGAGKTTWLAAAAHKAAGVPIVHVALARRQLTAADVVATLAAELNAPPEARASVEALTAWLRSLPRQVFILDDLEHLFLRGLEAWSAWEAFLDIVEHSAPSVFWLCALAHHPYRYLVFARGGATVFREIVHLPRWSEQKLAELLRARTLAGGYTVSFEDLVVDEDESVEHATREQRTERDFNRLLWDYSQGCPRVALHFWQRSLVPAGEGRLRVRLFSVPSENELEALDEVERFVLASVVWHDSLTTEEAARSLCFERLPCEDALAKMVELGVIDDHRGRHRVTTRWQVAVTNYLVRKHLIQP